MDRQKSHNLNSFKSVGQNVYRVEESSQKKESGFHS